MTFWVRGLARPLSGSNNSPTVLSIADKQATKKPQNSPSATCGTLKAGYATLHPVDTGAAIPIYPSLTEGTSDRWARGEIRAHLDALRP